MEYNKNVKSTRILTTSGPRDVQRRQSMADKSMVDELQTKVRVLEEEIKNRPVQKGYSAEELDEEINKAVSQVIEDMENKYEYRLHELEKYIKELTEENIDQGRQISKLEGLIEAKNEMIKALKESKINSPGILPQKESSDNGTDIATTIATALSELVKINSSNSQGYVVQRTSNPNEVIMAPSRPVIKEVVIDPLEKDAGKNLKPHIKHEEVVSQESTQDKLAKLKQLGITLPKKKSI